MPDTEVRVVGSNYTTFTYKGAPIAFLESVSDSGQKPIGQAYQAITPLGYLRPKEIVTQKVLGEGQLDLVIRELWNAPVWWQLAGLEGTGQIGDVFERLRTEPSYVSCQKIIQPPNGRPPRGILYHNCVVFAIDDGDTISIAGLSVARTLSLIYTHKTTF